MSDFPFVTCLCLTKGRKEWLPGAVASFLQQDYAGHKELLIVADSFQDYPGMPDQSGCPSGVIWLGNEISITVKFGPSLNVGEKRNFGCESASLADVIAIWDDDDYSAPGRLTQQVETLLSSGKAVTGYTSMKFTDGREWWNFSYYPVVDATGEYEFVLATSLCFRRDWWQTHPFEDMQVGQDERFALAASAADQLAPCPDLDLMYATIHPGNTSPRVRINGALVGSNWEPLPGYVSPHPSVFPLDQKAGLSGFFPNRSSCKPAS